MLPYRLRPPVYGGKLKQKREAQGGPSLDDRTSPYRDGGPVERAVRADLLALRPAFEEKLLQQQRIAAATAADDSPSDDNQARRDRNCVCRL